jgi:hypothetical protein
MCSLAAVAGCGEWVWRSCVGQSGQSDRQAGLGGFSFVVGCDTYVRVIVLVFCSHGLMPLFIESVDSGAGYVGGGVSGLFWVGVLVGCVILGWYRFSAPTLGVYSIIIVASVFGLESLGHLGGGLGIGRGLGMHKQGACFDPKATYS